MNWSYALVAFSAASDVLIGGYVFFKDPSRPLRRVFFIFTFGMALLGTSMVLLFATHHLIFDRLLFTGGYLTTFGLVLLSLKFPDDELLPRGTWSAFLPLATLAALTPFGFLVRRVIFRPDGILQPVNGPGIGAFVVIIGSYIVFSIWQFWKRYRTHSGLARLQMQYLALGAGTFTLFLFVCNVLLPAFGIFDFNLIGPISSLAFVVATAYAIIRHHMLDIRVVIQRSAVYLALLAVVVVFYLGCVFALNRLLHQVFDKDDIIFLTADIAVVCGGIFIVPLIERYLRHATDKFFFKDKYHYPQALLGLTAILNQNIEAATIVERTAQALKKILKLGMVQVLLFEDTSGLAVPPWRLEVQAMAARLDGGMTLVETGGPLRERYGIEAIVPIALDGKALGAVVLGPKLSGDPYYKEDAELLATFCSQAAVALEKARLFEEVRTYSATLERRVRERTAELERLQEEQRQMMIDISHRLQTPLTAVKSELDFMKRRMEPSKHMDAFEHSIDGISKFIYDLLNLATLGIRGNGFTKEVVDLTHLLRELVEYFGVMAEEQKIDLVAHIEPAVLILGNREHIEELVTNLVSNAFKYLQAGHEKRVSLVLRRENNGNAVLIVEDTGRGILPEDLNKIFDRFYRGTRSSEAPAGTGLGLAIAKNIVENHGGTINIESEVGQGTKVVIQLPLAT